MDGGKVSHEYDNVILADLFYVFAAWFKEDGKKANCLFILFSTFFN